MPTEAAVLSSSLAGGGNFEYFNKFRPWIYQTVHFTVHKPWRYNHKVSHPFLCTLFREWNESMHGIEEYYDIIEPLENKYLENCPPVHPSISTDR